MRTHVPSHQQLSHAAGGARHVIAVGPWKVSAVAIAWTTSVVLHVGILAGTRLLSWQPPSDSQAQITFAHGEQAIPQTVQLVDWSKIEAEINAARPDQETDEQVCETDEVLSDTMARVADCGSTRDSVSPQTPPDTPPPTHPVTADLADTALAVETALSAWRSAMEDIRDRLDSLSDAVASAPSIVEVEEDVQPTVVPNEQVETPAESTVASAVKASEPAENNDEPDAVSPIVTTASSGTSTGVEIAHLPAPRYPPAARRRGEQGRVVVRVEVLANGSVGKVEVVEDAGYPALKRAALAAARKGRYIPATSQGQPVDGFLRVPFRFEID